ncbi:MAG: N-acyl homoserine lactonase family protein [Pseudomonadota bacterium]
MSAIYEVFALRYARGDGRKRYQNFSSLNLDADRNFNDPMPLDFYVWLICGNGKTILVDTGFGHKEAARRGRTIDQTPADCLRRMDVDPANIKDVVLTHLHFDHAGTMPDFPNATFHLQEEEMVVATGKYMGIAEYTYPFSADVICDAVRAVYAGRVNFLNGDVELAQNITLHKVGGHSAGLQVVRVLTRRGWMVLASDAVPYYENLSARNPFTLVYNMPDMHLAFRTVEQLADAPDLVIPGHDRQVIERHQPVRPELSHMAVRLD